MFRSFWSGAAQTSECFQVWLGGMLKQANVSKFGLVGRDFKRMSRSFFKMFDMSRTIRLSEAGFNPNFETLPCFSRPRPETAQHSSKTFAVRANYRNARQTWIFAENCSSSAPARLQILKLSKNHRFNSGHV